MSDRFDLEQQIMGCWNVTTDLDTLYEGVLESGMSTDQIANILLGMKQLYELKFDKCFKTFEKLIADGSFKTFDKNFVPYYDDIEPLADIKLSETLKPK